MATNTYAGAGDLRLAAVLAGQFYQLLAAKSTALPFHPSFVRVPTGDMPASLVIKVPRVGLNGYDVLGDIANEDTASTDTAFTDGSSTLTLARKALSRANSDTFRLTDVHGLSMPESLARDAMGAYAGKLLTMATVSGATFSTDTGPGSGVNADYASFLAAVISLSVADNNGPLLAVLHGRQWGDIQTDLSTLTGADFVGATRDQAVAMGETYKGRLAGADLWVSNYVPTANAAADRRGFICSAGGLLYASAPMPASNAANAITVGDVSVEFDRDARKGHDIAVYSAWLATAIGEDARGLTYTSDA